MGLGAAWWVATHAQLAQARGDLVFNEKARVTDNCSYIFPTPTTAAALTEKLSV